MRVIVADDDALLPAGLASLLERSGFAVAGRAGNAEELFDLVGTHAPDLVIVDIPMPQTHAEEGLAAAHAIREEFRTSRSCRSPRTSRSSTRWNCWPAVTGSDTCSRVV